MHCLYQRLRLQTTNVNDVERTTIVMMTVGLRSKFVIHVGKKATSVAFAGRVTMTEKQRAETEQKLQGQ